MSNMEKENMYELGHVSLSFFSSYEVNLKLFKVASNNRTQKPTILVQRPT